MAAACAGQVITQRWAQGAGSGIDHAVAVGTLIAGTDGDVYTFGSDYNGTDTSYLVTRRNNLQSPGSSPIFHAWPDTDDAEIRVPVGLVVSQRSGPDSDPRILVTGTDPSGGKDDIITICYYPDLTVAWTARYSNDDGFGATHDAPVAIMANDSMVFIVGRSEANSGGSDTGVDTVVLAYDVDDGDPVFTDRYETGLTDVPAGAVLVDNVVYTIGTTTGGTYSNMFFLKHDPTATPKRVWANTWALTAFNPVGVAITTLDTQLSHAIYAAGYISAAGTPGNKDWLTMRVDTSDGTLDWITSAMGGTYSGDDRPTAVAALHYKDDQGAGVDAVVVTGHTHDATDGNEFTTMLYLDLLSSGSWQWDEKVTGAFSGGDDRGVQIRAQSRAGGNNPGYIYVTGYKTDASNNRNMYHAKYLAYDPNNIPPAPEVRLRWEKTFPLSGNGSGDDVPFAMDWQLNVYDSTLSNFYPSLFIAGMSVDAQSGSSEEDFITIRYVEESP